MDAWLSAMGSLMERGGPVMWPLLGLSVVALTLILERAWFFMQTNSRVRVARVMKAARGLREGDVKQVQGFASRDGSVYGKLLRNLTGASVTPAAAGEAIEAQRASLERFMPTLSAVITAAPMLGILGTVFGIIEAFELLGQGGGAAADASGRADLAAVGAAIGEALITTAAGIVVALVVLFPFVALRAQIERTLGRLEGLAASAGEAAGWTVSGFNRSESTSDLSDE